jgi:hypothetical protein
MAVISSVVPCDSCVVHTQSYDVYNWVAATGAALTLISQVALIDEIPVLAAQWLTQDGTTSFELEFTDSDFGHSITILYVV